MLSNAEYARKIVANDPDAFPRTWSAAERAEWTAAAEDYLRGECDDFDHLCEQEDAWNDYLDHAPRRQGELAIDFDQWAETARPAHSYVPAGA